MSRRTPHGATVAYLTKRFPRLSETFILDEILGLEEAGVPLRLYAGANPGEPVIQPDVALVASPVTYLHANGTAARLRQLGETVIAHTQLLAGSPVRYGRTVQYLLRHSDRRTSVRNFIAAGRLARYLRRDRARHLHAAFAHTPASIAHYTHLLTGLPFSFAGHAKDIYTSNPRSLAEQATAAEFMLVCSASAAEELRRRTGPEARIVLAYHGVDSERFRPGPACTESHEEVRLLAVGRLVEKKGYPVLLDAVAALVASGRSVQCEIVGGGDGEAALGRQIDRLGLGRTVTLRGALTHQEIADGYRTADVFVQASVVLGNGDRDGVPNSLLEAMASGLPVVASRVAGIPEVVSHGVTGLLVPPGDATALASELGRVVDDAGLRRRLGDTAREHVVATLDRRVCGRRVAALFGNRDLPAPARTPAASPHELQPAGAVPTR